MNTQDKKAKILMENKAVIPLPGVDASELPETAPNEAAYETGQPFQPLVPTGSIGYGYLIGAALAGYFLFVKK